MSWESPAIGDAACRSTSWFLDREECKAGPGRCHESSVFNVNRWSPTMIVYIELIAPAMICYGYLIFSMCGSSCLGPSKPKKCLEAHDLDTFFCSMYSIRITYVWVILMANLGFHPKDHVFVGINRGWFHSQTKWWFRRWCTVLGFPHWAHLRSVGVGPCVVTENLWRIWGNYPQMNQLFKVREFIWISARIFWTLHYCLIYLPYQIHIGHIISLYFRNIYYLYIIYIHTISQVWYCVVVHVHLVSLSHEIPQTKPCFCISPGIPTVSNSWCKIPATTP